MLSRFFSSYTRRKRKREKEISLSVDDMGSSTPERGRVSLRVSQSALLEHSALFREMRKGELRRSGRRIVLEDVTPLALRKIVQYMQESSSTFLNHSEALETLAATDKYKIDVMSKICVDTLVDLLEPDNVCEIYEACTLSPLQQQRGKLQYHCLRLVDSEAERVLRSRGFSTLKKPAVIDIIKRTSLNVESESSVFGAVLGWGLNACLRRGGDPNDEESFLPLVRYLFEHVRFATMTDEELSDPEIHKYHRLLSPPSLEENHHLKKHSASTTSSIPEEQQQQQKTFSDRYVHSTSTNSSIPEEHQQPRRFSDKYVHRVNIFEQDQHHQVKSGESFAFDIEVLKGRVFLTGLTLACEPFAASKGAACLYVSASAVNDSSVEKRIARGTFSCGRCGGRTRQQQSDEASLNFADPLPASESDLLRISLSVKRAENIRAFAVKRDVQIAMPDCGAVAMKVSPKLTTPPDTDGAERCILKGLEYFF